MFFIYDNTESCTTPLGVSSSCVLLNECPTLITAFDQKPIPSHVINFLRQSQCGFEGYTPKVCCGPLPSQQSVTQVSIVI